jgi:hypothetical protein
MLICLSSLGLNVSAESAEKVLTFVGLPCGLTGAETGNLSYDEATGKLKGDYAKALQNFYMVGSEIYVTQRKDDDTYLSRCEITGTGSSTIAACRDYVILEGYGHGESLEVNTYDGDTYIWVGANANTSYTSYYWATGVKRIEYIKTSNVTNTPILAQLGTVRTLNNMNCATADGSSLGTVKRVSVAIADGSDRIGFRIELTNNDIYYSIYDLSDVNVYMDSNVTSSMSENTLKSACKSTFKCNVAPNNSYQGHDMVGVGTNNKFLYLIGGNAGEQPKISKLLYTNNSSTINVISGSYTVNSTTTVTNVGNYEVEGIKISGSNLYFALNTGSDEAYSTVLYKITTP